MTICHTLCDDLKIYKITLDSVVRAQSSNNAQKDNQIISFFYPEQKDFATKIGLSQNAVSQYITGKRKPDYETIHKLIDFGVSPLFLFFNFNEPFDNELNMYIKDRKEKEINSEIAAKEKEIEELRKMLS